MAMETPTAPDTDRPAADAPRIVEAIDWDRLIRLVLIVAITFEVVFVLGDLVINRMDFFDIGAINRFWNITREDSVSSWFGVTQTWMVGLTALLLYLLQRNQPRRSAFSRTGWLVVGLFLLYLAFDDGSEFHERVGTTVQTLFGGEGYSVGNFPSYAWQVVFLPLLTAFAIFVLVFVLREMEDQVAKRLVVTSIVLLATAVGIDFIEGLEIDSAINPQGWLVNGWGWPHDTVRHYAKALEEFIEMLAMTLLWVALLRHLAWVAPRFGFDLEWDALKG